MEVYSTLIANPIGSLAYFFLILTFLSLWINRKIWIWLPLFAVSFTLGYFGGIVELKALIPIGILFVCHAFLTREIGSFWRLFIVMIAAIISISMFTHFMKGFYNIKLLSDWQFSADALPINLYLNFDKPMIALFILTFTLPLITTKKQLLNMLYITLPWAILTIVLTLGIGSWLHVINFDLKFPMITFIWLVIQLFFVVIPEEVFFRGFLQKEITLDLNNKASGILAIIVVSLLYALLHLLWIPDLTLFFGVFILGIFYGGIYLITDRIESSILVHYLFNIAHFFFFTYPILSS